MSIDLVAACLWLDLPPARKLVLLALCERANLDTGKCWPGREEISIRSSVTPRNVTTHLQALERDGWITSGKRPGSPGIATTRWVSVSQILTLGAQRLAEYQARRLSRPSEGSSHAPEPQPSEGSDTQNAEKRIDQGKMVRNQPSYNRQRTAKRQGFKKPEHIPYADLPRSDESDLDRPPDAKVERWLIKEMVARFSEKVVAKHLRDCDSFFVWRKIKQLVDEGERGVLKDLMPRAMAEYQAEVASIVMVPDDDTPEVTEIYRKIAADNQAKAEEEYQEWERAHYPATA